MVRGKRKMDHSTNVHAKASASTDAEEGGLLIPQSVEDLAARGVDDFL